MYRLSIEAFVLDAQTETSLRDVMGDISLFRSTLNVFEGGMEAAIPHYSTTPTTDLLLVQTTADRDGLIDQLERLSGVVGPDTSVMVIGSLDSIDLYRTLKEMGVGGYLVAPFTRETFLKGLREVMGADKAEERGRVIAVFGAKGGIGASTISHNLAWSLSRIYKKPVALLDLDLHFGSVAMDFNQEPKYGFRDALSMADKLDEPMMDRLFSKEGENLWLLASNPSLSDVDLMTPEALDRVIEVVAKMSSFVVLDIPHVWGVSVSEAMVVADELVVVAEPDLLGLRNTQLLFENLGPSRPQGTATRCVLNKVGLHRETELSGKDFAETLGATPLAILPWEPATFRAASANGQMLGENKKQKSKVPTLFDDMATRVSGRKDEDVAKKKPKQGLMAALFSGKKAAKPVSPKTKK